MENVDLQELKSLVAKGAIVWKEHAIQRMAARRISKSDVAHCILSGEIIEDYPKDYPAASCLILGNADENRKLHVVCSVLEGMVCIITAYVPDNNRWEGDLKTRKEMD